MTHPIDDLKTVRDFLRYASSRFAASDLFYGHGTDNVWDEAVQLVMRTLHLPLENNTLFLDANLTWDERHLILERLERRIDQRIPLAYLLGEAWFMGMPFQIDERVLVPRSPLAELIVTGVQPWLGNHHVERILDLCTGSGCIGIAAATVFDDARVDLADISPDALAVAEANITMHELGDRVRTVQSDVFNELEGRYDLILSNPPYVDADDMASMPDEFHHEPVLGLAAGHDGLEFAHRILAGAHARLNPGGLLIVEVGNSWPALEAAYPALPFVWLEFEQGGDGVFLLTAEDLAAWSAENQ
ncbi:MAG: 50S ribosomal protein L3 N(5)-glutamine methyltransferase [Marinobacter sp.]|uniref:50S ribosomal protein L3 N(5)-glutamine methyltransferase n=1 Tax=Marinobacter sp. TaxID=50741 RepID=UPI0034A00AEB